MIFAFLILIFAKFTKKNLLKLNFFQKVYIQISDQMSVLERKCQGPFESLVKNTSSHVSKIFNCNQRDSKFQKKKFGSQVQRLF